MKEAAVQRRHNLYRDSIVLTNSDPNLHLLGENPAVDWAAQFGGEEPDGSLGGGVVGGGSGRRRRQVVSMIQLDGVPLPYESCLEVPGVELIPEEEAEMLQVNGDDPEEEPNLPDEPMSPDSVNEIRYLINPMLVVKVPVSEENQASLTNGTEPGSVTITLEDGETEEGTLITTVVEEVPRRSPRDKTSPLDIVKQLVGNRKEEADEEGQEEAAIENAIQEIEISVQEDKGERIAEVDSDVELAPPSLVEDSSPHRRDDSGFQSPSNEGLDEGEHQPSTDALKAEDRTADPGEVEVVLEQRDGALNDSETGENFAEKMAQYVSDIVCDI